MSDYFVRVEQLTAGRKVVTTKHPVQPAKKTKPDPRLAQLSDELRRTWKDRKVDVVVAVHDEPHHARRCLEAIRNRTPEWLNYRLTVVDNACEEFTRVMLPRWRLHDQLLRVNRYRGYLPAIHAAVRATDGEWVVFVDQQTTVAPGWMEGLLLASDSTRAGMVAPWNNRRIPAPSGSNYRQVGERLRSGGFLDASPMSFPGGSCVMVCRMALEKCGGLDVDFYGVGYGEFADLYMRAISAGWFAVRANLSYVHVDGPGQSEVMDWLPVNGAGYTRFVSRWGAHARKAYAVNAGKDSVQEVAAKMLATPPAPAKKLVFVFPDLELCGLTLAATHLCNAMVERGWDASFAFAKMSPGNSLNRFPRRFTPSAFGTRAGIVKGVQATTNAFAVATTWITAEYVREICKGRSDLTPIYYVQDDERRFLRPSGKPVADPKKIEASYSAIPNLVFNSQWVREAVKEASGKTGARIGIGVDSLMFHPMPKPTDRVRIMVHCRPTTPRRGWPFIVQVLNEVARRDKDAFELVTFDQEPDKDEMAMPWWGSIGRVSPEELARHMGTAHIFLEGSVFQGWGMQALEAMACGCALVCTNNGGIDSFGRHGKDCLIVQHGNVKQAADWIQRLIGDREYRSKLGARARRTAEKFDWREVAWIWDLYLSNLKSK